MSRSDYYWGRQKLRGSDVALSECIKDLDHFIEQDNAHYVSRFFERVTKLDDEGQVVEKMLVKRRPEYISSCVDMHDDDGPFEFLYCDTDGELYPVTFGSLERCEMNEHQVVYGHSDIIANGKVVGTVTYTDH